MRQRWFCHKRLLFPPRRTCAAAALLLLLVLALVVSGCATNRSVERNVYVVKQGDTLYGIGQRYGIDWHNLARWNQLQPPYRLYVGQRLDLSRFPRIDYSQVGGSGGKHVGQAPPPQEQASRRAANSGAAGSPQLPPDLREPQTPAVAQSPEPATATTPSQPASSGTTATGPTVDGWQWPVQGKIVRAYSPANRHHGIEIGGKKGEAIAAASSGKVVYNGSALKGYGHLIIIKHNDHYLSAYGFLLRSLVQEGQTVRIGQHIADMGLGPGNKPMLLFEIRRDGEPVNPLGVLPDQG